MSTALDMSLDDIITKNKKSSAAVRRGRGSGGPGPARRSPNRFANRPAPYTAAKVPGSARQHGGYAIQTAAIETGTKLYVSNLDYGVSDEDIMELFSEVGDLKRFSIHYDRSGRSKGTAEVVFQRCHDAVAAVRKYSNVLLDGKPLKINIVGTNISTPDAPMVPNGTSGNSNGYTKSGPVRGGFTGWSRDGCDARGRVRGGGRGNGVPKSATELDADLEKYHKGAMEINQKVTLFS